MKTITFDLKDAPIENFKRVEPLVLNVYNQNFVTKTIDLFSKEQEKHTGILSYDKTEDELNNEVEKFKKGDGKVSLLRVTTTELFKLMYNGMFINGKKIMYMDYFSLNQFQTGIMDIPLIENVKKMEVELAYGTSACYSLFVEEINQSYLSNKNIDCKKLCIIASNKSREPKKINLLDFKFKNGFTDNEIEIEIPVNDVQDNEILNTYLIRAFSRKIEQLNSEVKFNDSKVEQSSYWSACQFQSIGVDMPIKTEIKFGNNFEITLLPNTKIMYMFYGK